MVDTVIDLEQGVVQFSIRMSRRGREPMNVRARIEYADGSNDEFIYATRDPNALPYIRSILGTSRQEVRKAFRVFGAEASLIPQQRV